MIFLLLALAGAFEPEVHRVSTVDGAEIVLHRKGGEGPPVVLVHGVSSNHRFWDVQPGASLADHLAGAGYDVWNLDLRGHGDALKDGRGRKQRPDWDIDDYGKQDLPAAFAHVRSRTGAERVHYVGHSMGGMVLAVYLATEGDAELASAVVVASPLDFREPDLVLRVLLAGGHVVGPIRRLPTPMGAKGLALFRRELPGQTDAMLHNPANFDRKVEGAMLRSVVSPMTRGEIRQFSRMAAEADFRSADGETIWRHDLIDVTLPMFFVAGRMDRVATPERVLAFHDAVGSEDKAFVVVSEANGFSGDYGHLDACCARQANTEVWPMIELWLDSHPAEDR